MNNAKRAAVATRNFVRNHKVAIAVVATTAVCVSINRAALKQHNDFLKQHDLYDEFYALTDDEQ